MYDHFNPMPFSRGVDNVPAAADNVRTTRFGLPGRKKEFTPAVPELVGATYVPRQGRNWTGEEKVDKLPTAAEKSAKLSEDILEDRRLAAQEKWLAEALKFYA